MSKTLCHLLVAGLLLAVVAARGVDAPAKFLGAQSCASTSCHGGGGAKQNQFLIWSLKDFHSQRPVATLATARSKQIADALDIKNPTADTRCTVCHAPLNLVPENLRGENFKVSEGVSCESCHGAAEKWIRSHTRKDYTPTDRTAAGMRDLKNLYVRANTCVACHQNVDADILKAGHPELIFELDGQSVAEPKHWQEGTNWNGAQAWYVGQAVALREMSWQLTSEKAPTARQTDRWAALLWLMETSGATDKRPVFPTPENLKKVQASWDEYARKMAAETLESGDVPRLPDPSTTFRDSSISQPQQACRAERLVLALDRLLAAENNHRANAELNQLFKLAQSFPDFDPPSFAAALDKFAAAIGKN